MPFAGEQLPWHEVARLAHDAGWRDRNLIIAVAVCDQESLRFTEAWADNKDDSGNVLSTDYGLWQVNSIHLGKTINGREVTEESLYDPAFNAEVAHSVYKGRGGTFNAWVAFSNGNYLHVARKACTGVRNYWWREFEAAG